MRITIKSRTSLNFGPNQPRNAELVALEPLKNSNRLIMGENLVRTLVLIFDWIFFILASNKDNHISLDKFDFSAEFHH